MKAHQKAIFVSVGLATLTPIPAFAHPMKGVGDFYAGMLHPLITIESVLPLVAFSLLAGKQRREAAIPLLTVFPTSLIVGAVLAKAVIARSYLLLMQLILTAILGILVATEQHVAVWILVAISAVLGILVGCTNAVEVLGRVSALRFVAGLAVSGLLLLVYGNGLVRNLKAEWSRVAIRVVGSWIAAVSILVLGLK